MEDDKRKVTVVDLDSDFKLSYDRVEELRAGRHLDDIPLSDEYWKAVKRHRAAHSK